MAYGDDDYGWFTDWLGNWQSIPYSSFDGPSGEPFQPNWSPKSSRKTAGLLSVDEELSTPLGTAFPEDGFFEYDEQEMQNVATCRCGEEIIESPYVGSNWLHRETLSDECEDQDYTAARKQAAKPRILGYDLTEPGGDVPIASSCVRCGIPAGLVVLDHIIEGYADDGNETAAPFCDCCGEPIMTSNWAKISSKTAAHDWREWNDDDAKAFQAKINAYIDACNARDEGVKISELTALHAEGLRQIAPKKGDIVTILAFPDPGFCRIRVTTIDWKNGFVSGRPVGARGGRAWTGRPTNIVRVERPGVQRSSSKTAADEYGQCLNCGHLHGAYTDCPMCSCQAAFFTPVDWEGESKTAGYDPDEDEGPFDSSGNRYDPGCIYCRNEWTHTPEQHNSQSCPECGSDSYFDGICDECGYDADDPSWESGPTRMNDGSPIKPAFKTSAGNWYAGIYETNREYGGPEEGGWWYNTGSLVDTLGPFNSRDEAEAAGRHACQEGDWQNEPGADDSSIVYSGGNYTWDTCQGKPPEYYPEETPYYE
jgi:hypothetical protein